MFRISLVLSIALVLFFTACQNKEKDPTPETPETTNPLGDKVTKKWALEKTIKQLGNGETEEQKTGIIYENQKEVTLSCNDSPYTFTFNNKSGVNYDTLTIFSNGAVNWRSSSTATTYAFSNSENTGCTHEVVTNSTSSLFSGYWTINNKNELVLVGSFSNTTMSKTSVMKIEQISDNEMILSATKLGQKTLSYYKAI